MTPINYRFNETTMLPLYPSRIIAAHPIIPSTGVRENLGARLVYAHDFADPDVIKVGNTYYAYATNSNERRINIQVARSFDLLEWEPLEDALPVLPPWAVRNYGWVWAPEVCVGEKDDSYVMYFTARLPVGDQGVQAIGAAVSRSPVGPFTPLDQPLMCQVDEGGSIDPVSFVEDDGRRFLLWKNDGNSRGMRTWISIQEVTPNGLELIGEPARLIRDDQPWEGPLVEGPTLWKQDGKYYLFYSANVYKSIRYGVGYAIADHLLGPYRKSAAPLLTTQLEQKVLGPGGQDIIAAPDGSLKIIFHAWPGIIDRSRYLYAADLHWNNGVPVIESASPAAVVSLD